MGLVFFVGIRMVIAGLAGLTLTLGAWLTMEVFNGVVLAKDIMPCHNTFFCLSMLDCH